MLKSFQIENYKISMCFASQIGLDKQENQDSIFFNVNDNSFGISICDGLGSAPLSAQGSYEAARIMVGQLLDGSFEKKTFKDKWLKTFQENPQKYNTTAKFVFIKENLIRLGGIGDGIIVLSRGKERYEYASHGDFSNQTSCIFDSKYEINFVDESIELKCPLIIMISTDGFSEDIEENGLDLLLNSAYESLQDSRFSHEFNQSLTNLLENWPNATNGDDKTVAFILVEEQHE